MGNHVYIATSLDGFIATEDGGVDWLMEIPNPDGSDFGFAEFMQKMDALVMGRNTFEFVQSSGEWPYEMPVFVLSNSLKSLPKEFEGKAEIINGELKSVIRNLQDRDFNNLYIDGGKLIQSFLREDLIDELIITKIPILLGKGIPLFGNIEQQMKFTHRETKVHSNALVMSSYSRKR